MTGFQGARRIVQVRVNTVAIERTRTHPNIWKGFTNEHVTPARRELEQSRSLSFPIMWREPTWWFNGAPRATQSGFAPGRERRNAVVPDCADSETAGTGNIPG